MKKAYVPRVVNIFYVSTATVRAASYLLKTQAILSDATDKTFAVNEKTQNMKKNKKRARFHAGGQPPYFS